MKPTESLPLEEWYKLAEKLGSIAGRMIELGMTIENLPDDAPESMIRDFSQYMHGEIFSEGDNLESTLYLIQNDLDEYAASLEHHGDPTEEEYESSQRITG